MRRLLIIAAFALAGVTSASAGLNDICEHRTRGIVAGLPCVTKVMLDDAASFEAQGYFRLANTIRQNLARIEVIADKRRREEISEAQVWSLLDAANATFKPLLDQAQEEDRQQLIRQAKFQLYMSRRGDPAQQLMNTWSLQNAMHPNCSRWGVC